MRILHYMGIMLAACALCSPVAWAGTGKGHHVNIVSFQQDDEFSGTIDYPDTIKGSFGDVLATLAGKAEPFLMVHTPHIHPKDMVNVQVDALGQRADESMEDDGLNCEFVFDEKDGGFTLGGVCRVIVAGDTENRKDKFIMPLEVIPADAKGDKPTWKRLFVDDKIGTAFYANIER